MAAASALLWPAVEPIWAYVICSWRRLFSQRFGTGGGFELRTAPWLNRSQLKWAVPAVFSLLFLLLLSLSLDPKVNHHLAQTHPGASLLHARIAPIT